jgi:hypothetical protein
VLNALQVARAYIQLDRREDALRAVDDLAGWLTSLSLWQNTFPEDGELTWTACRCPHVCLVAAAAFDERPRPTVVTQLAQAWEALEASAVRCDVRRLSVRAESVCSVGAEPVVRLQVEPTEESIRWWKTEGKSLQAALAPAIVVALGP